MARKSKAPAYGGHYQGQEGQSALHGDVTTSCGKPLRKSGYYYVLTADEGAKLARFTGEYLHSGAAVFTEPGRNVERVANTSAEIKWMDKEEVLAIFPQWAR